MAELARTVERLNQFRAARERELAAARVTPPAAEQRLGVGHQVGDRVFDRISGQEVEVVGGTRENVVVPVTRK